MATVLDGERKYIQPYSADIATPQNKYLDAGNIQLPIIFAFKMFSIYDKQSGSN